MSILIKGLKMPKEYEFIDLVITGDGVVREYYEGKVDIEIAEAVELPDHGDLIDRDALIENAGMCVSDFGTPDEQWRPDRDWYLTINAQTIIIPAERSEE